MGCLMIRIPLNLWPLVWPHLVMVPYSELLPLVRLRPITQSPNSVPNQTPLQIKGPQQLALQASYFLLVVSPRFIVHLVDLRLNWRSYYFELMLIPIRP